ncbi:methyl-accepting chemotaxis protein [Paenibacillus aquistagni]|uniref:methyl-accepting chemotaxis protein n=1 Tax=Paenibacillus aquistagni TaxID=1852522 RepID=UPI00145B80E1|nr:methyl-accepting chemotaxis protein [Paenibacillus aquistagni]NMM53096.1 hypothetical protein [Paenibacillus aquistagni]
MLFKTTARDVHHTIQATDVNAPMLHRDMLNMLQIRQEDLTYLRQLEPLIAAHGGTIIQRHLEMSSWMDASSTSPEELIIGEQWEALIREYIFSLPKLEWNEQDMSIRNRIAKLYIQRDLTPERFIGITTRIYEIIFPLVIQKYPSKASSILIALHRVLTVDAEWIRDVYQRDHDFRYMEMNSESLEQIIKLDKVMPLLAAVDRAIHETSNVSAASEELSASIEEIAEHTMEAADKSETLVRETAHGQAIIHHSLYGFFEVARQFDETKDSFDALHGAIEEVFSIAQVIHQVADQTHLLSLNAAIEAARAGDEGLGFAVVAGEVRKLSEQTKASAEHITRIIQELRATAQEVGGKSQEMALNIHKQAEETQGAITCLEEITEKVQHIGQAAGNIAAIVEEQSAATEEIHSRMHEVVGQIETIQQHARDTGQAIYEMSANVNELRQEVLRNDEGKLTDAQMIRVMETDHLLWRWWVYNSLLGYHEMAAQQIGDHQRCRLGIWMERSKGRQELGSHAAFRALEIPHKKIHQLAAQAATQVEAKQYKEAAAMLPLIEKASEEVLSHLHELSSNLR